jgi:hypothetical protein
MRIWDVPVSELCRSHLLGEHRELHAVWSIITNGKKGYATHPEIMRWRGRLLALYLRHEAEAAEMARRGYRHHTPLDESLAAGDATQTEFVDTPEEQRSILIARGCGCFRR